ncbi:glucose-6-phosphate isomerase [Desulforhopalus singaporensis]|uniref:Glucose-6-phosphate isomerase n=1 Tax=Desulforhopalus singaporensis TaxID=91360 RepID=A0A1H0JU85_9BACT|nr:glucose-6-phosphate isomerase [Desulforhopalus singaporensis]SDO46981.1 glucose-6-phosphate isomerase [Desulforhopalus singaporensis]
MYKNFTQTKAFSGLRRCAQRPYDLTRKGALFEDDRLQKFVCRSPLVNLHYGTQRIDHHVLQGLSDMSRELELVEQFKALRRGAVANRIEGVESENRQVLHTACRDLFSALPCHPEATASAAGQLDKLASFLEKLDSGVIVNHRQQRFTSLVHIGIGGSDLGPRAVYEGLKCYGKEGRTVRFIANVDPDDAVAVLSQVDLSTTLVNIVSKSGTTLETLTNEEIVRAALKKAGLNPADHCIAVTGEGSRMDNSGDYLETFHMYEYIGGRYSTCSMVGAASLGFFLGMEQLKQFLEGAALLDEMAEEERLEQNIPLLMALIGVWNHNFLGCRSLAVLPYSQAMHRFPAHLQQCDMESNGKSLQRNGQPVASTTGPIVWGEPGTNGQHAFYQLLHQGTEIVPVEFIGFRRSQSGLDQTVENTTSQEKLLANLFAQMVALAAGKESDNPNRVFPGNRPSSLLLAQRLTPKTMGALLALYEAKIIFQGFVWNINSFDQEGVQLGKALATRFIAEISKRESDPDSLENYFLKQL